MNPSGVDEGRSRGASPAAFVVALAGYVILGLLTRTLVLNWVVGPLFPLLVLYVVPRMFSSVTRRRA